MKLSILVTNVFLALSLAATAQAQWISLPLPDTPRTNDGKPNLTAQAPRAADGHPVRNAPITVAAPTMPVIRLNACRP